MRSAGLFALPIVVGALVGVITEPSIGVAMGLGGVLAAGASLIVLTPGRGRDIAAGGAVSDAVSGWAEFHRELARSRRFERSFAIVRLSASGGHGDEALATVRDHVAGAARRTDRAWIDGNDVLVLLPETDSTTAAGFVARVAGGLTETLLTPTIATFPQDGITSGALISVAYGGAAVVPTPISAVRSDPRPTSVDADAAPEVVSRGG
jgi:hypothetical protein